MFERVLYDVVSDRLALYTATPTLLNEIFQPDGRTFRIADEEMAKIRALFADPQKSPKVRHGYARSLADLPCYTIVLSNESVLEHFLADEVTDDITTNDTTIYGAVEERTYTILVYADSPDLCYIMYKVLKAIIIGGIRQMMADGNALETTYSGMEIEASPQYIPETVYLRAINLVVKIEEYYEDPTSLNKVPDLTRPLQVHRDDVDLDGDGVADGRVEPVDDGIPA